MNLELIEKCCLQPQFTDHIRITKGNFPGDEPPDKSALPYQKSNSYGRFFAEDNEEEFLVPLSSNPGSPKPPVSFTFPSSPQSSQNQNSISTTASTSSNEQRQESSSSFMKPPVKPPAPQQIQQPVQQTASLKETPIQSDAFGGHSTVVGSASKQNLQQNSQQSVVDSDAYNIVQEPAVTQTSNTTQNVRFYRSNDLSLPIFEIPSFSFSTNYQSSAINLIDKENDSKEKHIAKFPHAPFDLEIYRTGAVFQTQLIGRSNFIPNSSFLLSEQNSTVHSPSMQFHLKEHVDIQRCDRFRLPLNVQDPTQVLILPSVALSNAYGELGIDEISNRFFSSAMSSSNSAFASSVSQAQNASSLKEDTARNDKKSPFFSIDIISASISKVVDASRFPPSSHSNIRTSDAHAPQKSLPPQKRSSKRSVFRVHSLKDGVMGVSEGILEECPPSLSRLVAQTSICLFSPTHPHPLTHVLPSAHVFSITPIAFNNIKNNSNILPSDGNSEESIENAESSQTSSSSSVMQLSEGEEETPSVYEAETELTVCYRITSLHSDASAYSNDAPLTPLNSAPDELNNQSHSKPTENSASASSASSSSSSSSSSVSNPSSRHISILKNVNVEDSTKEELNPSSSDSLLLTQELQMPSIPKPISFLRGLSTSQGDEAKEKQSSSSSPENHSAYSSASASSSSPSETERDDVLVLSPTFNVVAVTEDVSWEPHYSLLISLDGNTQSLSFSATLHSKASQSSLSFADGSSSPLKSVISPLTLSFVASDTPSSNALSASAFHPASVSSLSSLNSFEPYAERKRRAEDGLRSLTNASSASNDWQRQFIHNSPEKQLLKNGSSMMKMSEAEEDGKKSKSYQKHQNEADANRMLYQFPAVGSSSVVLCPHSIDSSDASDGHMERDFDDSVIETSSSATASSILPSSSSSSTTSSYSSDNSHLSIASPKEKQKMASITRSVIYDASSVPHTASSHFSSPAVQIRITNSLTKINQQKILPPGVIQIYQLPNAHKKGVNNKNIHSKYTLPHLIGTVNMTSPLHPGESFEFPLITSSSSIRCRRSLLSLRSTKNGEAGTVELICTKDIQSNRSDAEECADASAKEILMKDSIASQQNRMSILSSFTSHPLPSHISTSSSPLFASRTSPSSSSMFSSSPSSSSSSPSPSTSSVSSPCSVNASPMPLAVVEWELSFSSPSPSSLSLQSESEQNEKSTARVRYSYEIEYT
ncbi:uncharacterized protein MONOS_6326 [Monocercomonoides exilis]|uniref:uncharacterized protein n=1 Tax=Monocercomonoides exilis TaxID=2049356 RepID=UPI00355960E4|nr:hypothetical protein MONOS_6326 [Monocercomonoides exilis]|eukprot:MONOS_6326.1-p1 / transcript=MONOS_6326.1 / gene=MONOS_6326 / organism=Monocercomonoides_exilis_PA203 / gene_product=unspecified product / transcript_product=unspecified product / location=Mono_scaffold00197:83621-88124(+) / protein_length=1219 / sequence_SO=supercontig / SO=protein_coding / is_pseudo=false